MWARLRLGAPAQKPWELSDDPGQRRTTTITGGETFTATSALAYSVGLMPTVYCATYIVLDQVRKKLGYAVGHLPAWEPRKVIDWGSGTGSLAWHVIRFLCAKSVG